MLRGVADPIDSLDYAGFLQDALRDMVRRVLAQVAEQGLPGEHHFFITFRTDHPEARLPRFLRDQHPNGIRIILQHQFWDLEVDETAFSVGLNFGAARHYLTVPFSAILEFHDPSANLVIAFDPEIESAASREEPAAEPEPQRSEPAGPGSVIRFDSKRRK